jgi:hypothetical protein
LMRLVVGLAFALLMTGCASAPQVNFVPTAFGGATWQSTYAPGATSLGAVSNVSFMGPLMVEKRSIRIDLQIINRSPTPIYIGPEDFSATTEDGVELKVLSGAAYARKAQRQAFWTNVGTAALVMGGALAAVDAGTTTSQTTYSGRVSASGPNGTAYGTFNGTSTTTTYDQAKADAAAQRYAENVSPQIEENAQTAAQLRMQAKTAHSIEFALAPNTPVSTSIEISGASSLAKKLFVRVRLNNDVHVLVFELQSIGL